MTHLPVDIAPGAGIAPERIAAALERETDADRVLHILPGTENPGALVGAVARLPRLHGICVRIADGTIGLGPLGQAAATAGVPVTLDCLVAPEAGLTGFSASDRSPRDWLDRMTGEGRAHGLAVRWLLPMTSASVYRLEGLVSLSRKLGAEPVVLPAEALDPDAAPLAGNDRLFAWDFITYRMLDEDVAAIPRPAIAAYRTLSDVLAGPAEPLSSVPWGRFGPDLKTSTEHRTGGALSAALLAPTPDAPRGPTAAERRRIQIADIADVLAVGVPAHLRTSFASPAVSGGADPKMRRVLLVGAYGGEHIGDAAILGGVLHRIHARHGTTEGILMTQRPGHTAHLVPMLDVPVALRVQEYTRANIIAALAEVDGVVFAGGPLTDLPKQLVRHLETASRARRAGLTFVMEGIGPGTFARRASAITARRLVRLADRITIRVKEDADRAVIAGCKIEIGRDPAFDYLDTRGPVLGKMPSFEPAQIDALLSGTDARLLVGVNIRPVGAMFTAAPDGEDPVGYTRRVEDRFEREFAEGLASFARDAARPVTFVFFPMNAIQFGMSDLRSAWRIRQHLPDAVDFRVWEADASADGTIALLRRMDLAVSMRFHGAIFSLAQGLPVIGIDYRIGKRDKVAAVLTDAGFPENVVRIDELRAGWLAAKLSELAPRDLKSPAMRPSETAMT